MIFDLMLPAFIGGAALILMPRRLFFHVLGWVALFVLAFFIDFAHPLHSQAYGNLYIFGIAILFFGATIVLGAVALKLLLLAFLRFRPVDFLPSPLSSVLASLGRAMTVFQAWAWALVLAFVVLLFMRSWFQGLPALGAYVAAFSFVAAVFALALYTPPSVIEPLNICARAFKRILPGLVILSAPLAYSVVSRAEWAAGPYPYSIQVADGHRGYREAQSKLDLSYFTMRYSGSKTQYHALLIIDNGGPVVQILNWSYRMRDFDAKAFENYSVETGIENRPTIVCQPKRGFANDLPVLFP